MYLGLPNLGLPPKNTGPSGPPPPSSYLLTSVGNFFLISGADRIKLA